MDWIIDNKTLFTESIYNYYIVGGYKSWLFDRLSKFVIIESITVIYFFFSCWFDWTTGTLSWNPHLFGGFISLFVACQGILYLIKSAREFRAILYAREVYRKLELDDDMLSYATWKDITYRLVEYNIIDNELLIQCSVVRDDNFIMGLVEQGLLVGEKYMSEWYVVILSHCISLYCSNDANRSRSFSRICLTYGLLSFVLIPYLILYHITYSTIKYAVSIYKNPAYLFEMKWTVQALYTFRQFNELPHEIEARMRNAASIADKYNSLFPSIIRSKLAERLAFIISEIIIVLVVILYITPYGSSHSFIKIITSTMLIWSFVQTLVEPKVNKPNPFEVTRDMQNILMTSDMFCDIPNRSDHEKLGKLYTHRLHYALNELLGILTTPIFMIYIAMYREHVTTNFIDMNIKINSDIGSLFRGSEFNREELEEQSASKLMKSFHYYEQNYPASQSIQYSKMLSSRFADEQ